jgi:hypothetical protein
MAFTSKTDKIGYHKYTHPTPVLNQPVPIKINAMNITIHQDVSTRILNRSAM